MKKILLVFAALLLMVGLASCGNKTDNNTDGKTDDKTDGTPSDTSTVDKALDSSWKGYVTGNILLTTCGQSDLDIVYNLLEVAGVSESKVTSNNKLNASEVDDGSVVFLVLGTSNKGLGAAGTNVADETARAKAFGEKAAAGKIKLVVFHVGGANRRGDQSDPVIKSVIGKAHLLLVVEGGNSDGLFTTMASDNNVPIYLYSKASKMTSAIQTLFNL